MGIIKAVTQAVGGAFAIVAAIVHELAHDFAEIMEVHLQISGWKSLKQIIWGIRPFLPKEH